MADQKSNYELELYNAHICPFGMRAWFTILQKKIDVNLKDSFRINWIELGDNKPKEFSEKYALALGADPNSTGKAPTIQHNGKYMAESAVVAAYLDRYYNDEKKYGPSLIPSDPWDAAKVDLMTEIIGSHFISTYYGLLMNKDDSSRQGKIDNLKNKLLAFNKKLLESSEKGFLLPNGNLSMFEILAFPFFYRMEALERIQNVPVVSKWFNLDCDESKGLERVISWYQSVNSLDSVQSMRKIVPTERLVELYAPWSVDIIFYNNHVCPFGQRAWFALTAKKIKYLWKNCSLSGSPGPKEDYFKDAYAKAIGHDETSDGKVPIIMHNKKFLTESAQLVRYLDRCFDDVSKYGASLFPNAKDDPIGFHACECLCDWSGSHIMQAFYKILLNDDKAKNKQMIDTLYNDLKVLCVKLNEVSDSGLLLKSNELSAFEIFAFPFFWRFHLHPLIAKESKKDVPIDKWLEKDSKEFPELKRVQDWYNTVYNHPVTQEMLNDKEHKITIEQLATVYGKQYSKPLKD